MPDEMRPRPVQAEKVPNAIGSVNADLVGQTKALTSQLVKASEVCRVTPEGSKRSLI